MPGQTFYKDKPYVFVPLQQNISRKKGESHLRRLEQEYFSGRLKITMLAKAPLHFGQGELKREKEKLVHVLTREKGRVAYPGASFKGVIRSVFEAVSHSCILFRPADVSLNQAYPVKSKACSNKNEMCPACSVFGMLGYKGKINLTSFLAKENAQTQEMVIPELKSPFSEYPKETKGTKGNERLYYGCFEGMTGLEIANMTKEDFFMRKKREKDDGRNPGQFYGRKFYKHASETVQGTDTEGCTFECLPKDSKLVGFINYEGLTRDELAALALSLGLGWDRPIYHKIGYGKPAYFGSVLLKIEAIKPAPRYEKIQCHHDLEELERLAQEHRHAKDIQQVAEAIQEIWQSVDGECQWKKIGEGLSY